MFFFLSCAYFPALLRVFVFPSITSLGCNPDIRMCPLRRPASAPLRRDPGEELLSQTHSVHLLFPIARVGPEVRGTSARKTSPLMGVGWSREDAAASFFFDGGGNE